MIPTIHTETLTFDVHGFSAIPSNGNYVGTAFQLSDRMWKTVKANGIKNKGQNIWVYDYNKEVFAGVVLDEEPASAVALQHKKIVLNKYAYYKHIGPYKLLPAVGEAISAELKSNGFEKSMPYVEIYGHWTNDESKLETELYFNLK